MPQLRVDDQQPEGQLEEARHLLRQHLSSLGLKHSAQRERILRVFLSTHDHLSTEELHRLVREQDASIGYTTVYRSLKLFAECGLAYEVAFHDGVTRYEHSLNRRNHHHMVCTSCGASVEFFAPEIEHVQDLIAERYRYKAARHHFQIDGICEKCQMISQKNGSEIRK